MIFAKIIFAMTTTLLLNMAYAATSVTQAKFSVDSGECILLIELSSTPKYTVFSLTNPERLVIDLAKVDKQSISRAFSQSNFIAGVKGFRVGNPIPGVTRVVLDLSNNLGQLQTSIQAGKKGGEVLLIHWSLGASTTAGSGRNIPALVELAPALVLPEVVSTHQARSENSTSLIKAQEIHAAEKNSPVGEAGNKRSLLETHKAAKQGDAAAQYSLGLRYANGDGVAQNQDEAVYWYRKAAEQGHALAQFNLGARYANGQGVEQDYRDAAAWYAKAAEQGLANAQNNLGVLYYNGQGVPQNMKLAYKWLSLAEAAGDRMAVNNKQVAAAAMTLLELEQARALVSAWQAEHNTEKFRDHLKSSQDEVMREAQPETSISRSLPATPAPEVKQEAAKKPLSTRIGRFLIKGNTLLDNTLVERLLEPFKGNSRSYADIQRAAKSLEEVYRNAGYSAVHVTLPEQDISGGTVTLEVHEIVLGKVSLNGNQFYNKANIRNALPLLIEGTPPNVRALSANLQLANENPTRQLDIVFAQGKAENTVDAEVNVRDQSPFKVYSTLDNTGSAGSGMFRAGVGIQHNNLFNRDQAATLNYVTSPDHVTQLTQLTSSYRIPLYTVGDSMDLIAAHTNADAGAAPLVGGYMLTFQGKGNVYGIHYNHLIPNFGNFVSKISAGLDYRRYYSNACQIDGLTICGSRINDLTLHPLSVTFSGTLTQPKFAADFSTTLVHNLPWGNRGKQSDFEAVGGAGTQARYNILRFSASTTIALPKDWQFRMAESMQYTRNKLVSYENFSLVGVNAVRGYLERDVNGDKGGVINAEIYTPELAPKLHIKNGSVKLLGFVDRGHGWKNQLLGGPLLQDTVGSIGMGLRYTNYKSFSAKLDWALITSPGGSSKKGDSRGQLGIMVNL